MADVIYSYTPARKLNYLEQLAAASFVANGHDLQIFSYAPIEFLPAGAHRRDANEILPAASPVGVDRFRWEALFRKGGVWADLDMVALRPLSLDNDTDDAWLCAFESINDIGTGLIGSPPGHPLVKAMRRRSSRPLLFALCHPSTWTNLRHGRSPTARDTLRIRLGEQLDGAPEFCRVLLRHRLSTRALPPYHFYPVPRTRAGTLFDKTYCGQEDPFPNSRTVCLYSGEPAFREADRRGAVEPGSFVGALIRRYRVGVSARK